MTGYSESVAAVNSDATMANGSEYVQGYQPGSRPVWDWPGWIDNDARYSPQPDIQPIPISPVHGQQWPGMQVQLSNGWQYTNYGKRTPYALYIANVYSSASGPYSKSRNARPLPGERLQPVNINPPSQISLQNGPMSVNANPNGGAGTGNLGPGVSLAGRTFYG